MTERSKITWKKLGGGSFRLASGKIIKPNQVFEAYPEDIPVAFRDRVVPVNPDDLPQEYPLEVVKANYQVIFKSPGWYDVVDGNGKVVNEKRLRSEDAKRLVEQLS